MNDDDRILQLVLGFGLTYEQARTSWAFSHWDEACVLMRTLEASLRPKV